MEDFDMMESGGVEDDTRVSVPLGGPIYVSNLIGALTCIPEFEANALRLLQVSSFFHTFISFQSVAAQFS